MITAIISAWLSAAAPSGQITYVDLRVPGDTEQFASPGGTHQQVTALGAPASNAFIRFVRNDAEDPAVNFVAMDFPPLLPTTLVGGYFRDHHVGGETFVTAPDDGDVWTASVALPDGRQLDWASIVFLATFVDSGGTAHSNCFINTGNNQALCGSTSLVITWFAASQCAPPGTWFMNFSYSHQGLEPLTPFFGASYLVEPRVPPNTLASFNQGAFSGEAYDRICMTSVIAEDVVPCQYQPDGTLAPGFAAWQINNKGCLLSAISNVLTYHRMATSPSEFNTWLRELVPDISDPTGQLQIQRGFTDHGLVLSDRVRPFAATKGRYVSYVGSANTAPLPDLDPYICANGPQVMQVSDHHYVTVVGRVGETLIVNDPDGGANGVTIPASYSSVGMRFFTGPEVVFSDTSVLLLEMGSPATMLLTDPLGRRLGEDPETGNAFREIPLGNFGTDGLRNNDTKSPGPGFGIVELLQPPVGDYELRVTGTGVGTYDLLITGTTVAGMRSAFRMEDAPIGAGEVQTIRFTFDRQSAAGIGGVAGGFDGGGQRPRDVNKILTYIAPGDSPIAISPPVSTYPIRLSYASELLPATFSATLNGADVTAMFRPAGGTTEAVSLPLVVGKNVVLMSASATIGSRTPTDTDRLVIHNGP